MISNSATTHFLLTIYEPTRAASTNKSTRHLWKVFQRWFLSRQWLSFCWLFLSPHRLCALMNTPVTCWSGFVMIYESAATQLLLSISESTWAVGVEEATRHLWKRFRLWFLGQQRLIFGWLFLSPQGLWALTKQCVTYGRCFGDDFWVDNDLIFVYYFCVNRGYVRWWIQLSPMEVVSLMISESKRLSFQWLFLRPQGLCALMNPPVTCGSGFVYDLWVGSDLVFVVYFWVNRGCGRWVGHASPVEAVSFMISKSAAWPLFMIGLF
jgi:hypothetical protein